MIYMNEKMKEIISQKSRENTKSHMEKVIENIVARIKIINECIIYDRDGDIQEQQIDFNKIISFVGDLTGYEIGINEIRLNRGDVPLSDCMVLGDGLYDALMRKYPEKKLVVYILICDECIELRLHTYREEEGLWLDENLNKYNEPILYIMK